MSNDAQRGAGLVPVVYFSCSILVDAPTRLGCPNRIEYMRGPKMVVVMVRTRDRVKTTLASHAVMYCASVLATARARGSGMRVDAFAL